MSDNKEEVNTSMSLDNDVSGQIKLVSKDGKEFTIEKKAAFISTLVKTSLETDLKETEMPLPGVRGDILAKIIEYLVHHDGKEQPIIEKPLRSKVMKDVCKDPWDAEYIEKMSDNRQQLYDVILGANYMDIKPLLHLGCAKVASLIKGQPLEKIRDILSKGTKAEEERLAAAAAASAASSSSSSSSSSTTTSVMMETKESE